MHEIYAKLLILKCYESAILWFYPKDVSGPFKCFIKRIKVVKLDYFKSNLNI
jgi:hypothetical protein